MSYHDVEARRRARMRARRSRAHRRLGALAALLAVLAVVIGVLASWGAGQHVARRVADRVVTRTPRTVGRGSKAGGRGTVGGPTAVRGPNKVAATPAARDRWARATVPILMYHVINPPLRAAPFPGLYVPEPEFAAQMEALKSAGWHAITLNELEANWTHGVPLGPGKPIVLSFDNGYRSQYLNALPVLRKLGWVGVENIQLTGLPPSQGGLTRPEVRGLISAGWELDTQGISHADLVTLTARQLQYQVETARRILRRRFHAQVNWFAYPSGHYDAAVIAAVRAAGYVGSTTVVPGWASRAEDPYRLPRLRVLGGTTPAQLLSQIADARRAAPPPPSYL